MCLSPLAGSVGTRHTVRCWPPEAIRTPHRRSTRPSHVLSATGGHFMVSLPARRSGRTLNVVNPSREFEDIYDRMGQLMNFAFGGLTPAALADMPWAPLGDVSETDAAYIVRVELPG